MSRKRACAKPLSAQAAKHRPNRVDVGARPAHIDFMSEMLETDLKELGQRAADDVAGRGAVTDVAVESGADTSDRPVYHFWFRIDQNRSSQRIGLVFTRLIQRLSDELSKKNDNNIPVVHLLNAEDWKHRVDAKPN